MCKDDSRGPLETAPRMVEAEPSAPSPVLEGEPKNAPEEDRRREGDQAVPEDDLPVGETRKGLPCLRQKSLSSSSATSNRSASAPSSATLKIAASGSVLTAMIVPLPSSRRDAAPCPRCRARGRSGVRRSRSIALSRKTRPRAANGRAPGALSAWPRPLARASRGGGRGRGGRASDHLCARRPA